MSILEVRDGLVALYQVISPFIPFALIVGPLASVALEVFKKWVIDPRHKKTVAILKVIIVGITVGVHALLASVPDSAVAVMLRLLLTSGATSGLYLLFLKPAYNALGNATANYQLGKAVTANPPQPTTTHTFDV